jgi:bifunctional pyridoxal-dependent enzyme with beta-cystathionase and maltose regulon repressor activities
MGSLEFSKQLLTHADVAVAPGVGYGEDGEGYVRIAPGRERAAPAPGRAQREALPAEHGRQQLRPL